MTHEPAPEDPAAQPQPPEWPPPGQNQARREIPWWIWVTVAAAFALGVALGLYLDGACTCPF
jgi:hypothetical protein